MRLKDRLITGGCVCVPVIIIDRLLKAAVTATDDFTLVKGFIAITETRNPGAAFSLLSGSPAAAGVLSALVLALLTCYALFSKSMTRSGAAALFLVIGGGLANLCDRLMYGYVIDYIRTLFVSFPVFNFADMCVCVGAFLLILSLLLPKKTDTHD